MPELAPRINRKLASGLPEWAQETFVSKVRVQSFSVSLDGFGAGPAQSLDDPLGAGGFALHEWVYPTRTFKQMTGEPGGTEGVDETFAARSMAGLGAWIMGRHMFTPSRGPWPEDGWKGWWGDEPPYHCDVFVLTHHPRPPLAMAGGTTFHFVTDGIQAALERARASAKGKDIRIGGGVATIRQFLQAGLVDEVHLVMTPALLGSGEHLLHGIDLVQLGFRCSEAVPGASALHVVLTKG